MCTLHTLTWLHPQYSLLPLAMPKTQVLSRLMSHELALRFIRPRERVGDSEQESQAVRGCLGGMLAPSCVCGQAGACDSVRG